MDRTRRRSRGHAVHSHSRRRGVCAVAVAAVSVALLTVSFWTAPTSTADTHDTVITVTRTATATSTRTATRTVHVSNHGRVTRATARARVTVTVHAHASARVRYDPTRPDTRRDALSYAGRVATARARAKARSRAVNLAASRAASAAARKARAKAHQRTTDRGASTACGRESPVKADGTRWVCTFDDEFDGTSLDPAKWTAWNGVNYNTNASMCYYDDPSHVWERNGYLNLAVTRLAAATRQCATPVGPVTAQYGGAVVHTKNKFSQTGGRFEARIKFGGGTGLHDAFWLWPEHDKQLYPGHAEIDIAEPYGALPNTMFSAVHLNRTGPGDDGTVDSCHLTGWAGGFHTYGVEWTTTAISFFYDHHRCFTFSHWTALPGWPDSAPFGQPFFLILQTLVDNGSYAPAPSSTSVFPAVTQVDYVRAWK